MQKKTINGLTLFFDAEEQEAADIIGEACETSVDLIRATWDLPTPRDVRVYVMTSWLHFVFHSAPWTWCIPLALSLPLWMWRVRRMWRFAGGWAQNYGSRRAIGVKPPRILQAADRSIGQRVFVSEDDVAVKVQYVTCHELMHAFSAHLKLPVWLNEGLAMVTVDRFAGKPTVQTGTLDTLVNTSQKDNPRSYRGVRIQDRDALVYLTVRGYWITRYLEATHPGLLKALLIKKMPHATLERELATACGIDRDTFWREIDSIIVQHFTLSQSG